MKILQSLNAQQKEMISLIRLNFTNTARYMRQEREMAIRDRDKHHQQAIVLRRNNTMLQEQLTSYTRYPRSVRPSLRPSLAPSSITSSSITSEKLWRLFSFVCV